MNLVKILGAVGLCLAMAGCGSKTESSVNGMSAGDYYNQFVSEKSINCDGQSHPDNSASGSIGGQSITLKLMNDGTFSLHTGWSGVEVWSGSWAVDKTELVLNGVARASGEIVNEQTALSIQFPADGSIPVLLRGQSGILTRSTATYQCRKSE